MRNLLQSVKKDRITFNIFLISFIVMFLSFLWTAINFLNLPPMIPVFNQLPWGNERLVGPAGVFIPTIFFGLVFFFNFGFASFLYRKENPLLARIIAGITFTVALMNLLFIVKLFLLIS